LSSKPAQTNIIPEKELWAARKEMGEDKYQQEFECSFNAAVEGSYYGQIINDLEAKGRITTIDRDDLCRSFVAWDLGMGDSTCLWVCSNWLARKCGLSTASKTTGSVWTGMYHGCERIGTKASGRSSRTTLRSGS
jgi:hypothetical protein